LYEGDSIVGHLSRQPNGWVRNESIDSIEDIDAIPQRDFRRFNEIRVSSGLMHKICLLDSTRAVVFWTLPRFPADDQLPLSQFMDVWDYVRGEWVLTYSDMDVTWPVSQEGPFSQSSFTLTSKVGSMAGRVYDIREHPTSDPDARWESYSDYKRACQSYFAENELRYALVVWDLK
jgi:hypothetical protein